MEGSTAWASGVVFDIDKVEVFANGILHIVSLVVFCGVELVLGAVGRCECDRLMGALANFVVCFRGGGSMVGWFDEVAGDLWDI